MILNYGLMMHTSKFFLFSLVTLLTGCETLNLSGRKIIFPETPPIPIDQLKDSASSCQKDIQDLVEKRSHIPKSRRDEFDNVITMSDENCEKLENIYNQMKVAPFFNQALKQNLQHAQSIIIPGTRVIEDSKKSFFESFSKELKDDQKDESSPDSDNLAPLNESPIESEPLQ